PMYLFPFHEIGPPVQSRKLERTHGGDHPQPTIVVHLSCASVTRTEYAAFGGEWRWRRNGSDYANACNVALTVARRSSPHGIANAIGTSTPLVTYSRAAART